MPPMATSSAKRKWSDVFEDGEVYDKQSIMDLCTSKLRYVNPARPPRRRTEVPLLRNVLIVNTMKHLSAEMKIEKPMDYSTEDLSVDPGHFEGLPPLSELLTDIMLDPQPSDQQQQAANSFGWTTPGASPYPSLTPLEPSIPSYMDSSESAMEGVEEEKIVHDLLPCTSVIGIDPVQHSASWNSQSDHNQHSSSWPVQDDSGHHSTSWDTPSDPSVLDCFLSSASIQQSSRDSLDTLASDIPFQSSSGPLPSFNSLFESSQGSSFTELLQTSPGSPSVCTTISSSFSPSSTLNSFPVISGASTDDIVGNVNLTESELEILAMTFSSKLPHMSFEELVHALPQTSLLQQTSQPSQTFYVPSSLQQSSSSSSCDSTPTANSQCASYCRKDQPPPSVDDSSMVRVLVNL